MRELIATVFNYSLDGLLADEGTAFWTFCFDVNGDLPNDPARLDFLQGAYAHAMGRSAYEDELKRGGDGHIVVWGGVTLCARS